MLCLSFEATASRAGISKRSDSHAHSLEQHGRFGGFYVAGRPPNSGHVGADMTQRSRARDGCRMIGSTRSRRARSTTVASYSMWI
jgi:hypothetical protein